MASLTIANLSLPEFQVQATDRTESFIRSQRAQGSSFFAHGRTFRDSGSRAELTDRIQGVGFSSPILKPRVERTHRASATTDVPRNDPKDHKTPGDSRDYPRNGSDSAFPPHVASKDCIMGKKRRVLKRRPASPDDEHAARLAERRDRKRARRAIVNPAPTPLEKSPSESEDNGKTNRKAKIKKRVKVDSGLTLMQSFSATNIGKERLTLKPGPSMGFFNKGKASAPTKTKGKKGKHRKDPTFSESKFLNSTRPGSKLSQTDGSTSTSSDELPRPKHSKFFVTDPVLQDVNNADWHLSTIGQTARCSKKTVPTSSDVDVDSPDDVRGSEVWDIEVGKSLPLDDGNGMAQDVGEEVVLKTHWHRSGLPSQPRLPDVDSKLHAPQDVVSLSPDRTTFHPRPEILRHGSPSPSLAPSQSASQWPMAKTQAPEYQPQPNKPMKYHNSSKDEPTLQPVKPQPFRFRPINNLNVTKTYSKISLAPDSLLLPLCVEDGPGEVHSHRTSEGDLVILSQHLDLEPIVYGKEGENMGQQIPQHPHPQFLDMTYDGYSEGYEEDYQNSYFSHWQDGEADDADIYESQEGYAADNDGDYGSYQDLGYQSVGADEELAAESQGEIGGHCSASEVWDVDDEAGLFLDGTMGGHSDDVPEWVCEPTPKVISPTTSLRHNTSISSHQDLTSDPLAFSQGRSLLFGVEEPILQDGYAEGGLRHAQYDVERRLKDHWLPQRL